jgi:hypothetical protein
MTAEPLVIERSEPPRSILPNVTGSGPYSSNTWGDSAQFDFALPSLYGVLASPRSGQPFPRAPKPNDDMWFACGYWSALLHMMIFSLGWARPDRGLWRWYEDGKPTDDLRLRLLSQPGNTDQPLDLKAAHPRKEPPQLGK